MSVGLGLVDMVGRVLLFAGWKAYINELLLCDVITIYFM